MPDLIEHLVKVRGASPSVLLVSFKRVVAVAFDVCLTRV